jgi:hypothetical protein
MSPRILTEAELSLAGITENLYSNEPSSPENIEALPTLLVSVIFVDVLRRAHYEINNSVTVNIAAAHRGAKTDRQSHHV